MARNDIEGDVPVTLDAEWHWNIRRLQPYFRQAASELGNFRTCHLAKCRRARRCDGCYSEDEIGTTHYRQFPPCIRDADAQSDVRSGIREIAMRALRATGDPDMKVELTAVR